MNAEYDKKTIQEFAAKLVAAGSVQESSVRRLLAALEATGQSLDTVMVELGLMREDALARELADYFDAEFAENFPSDIDRQCVSEIGLEFLGSKAILPVLNDGSEMLSVIVANPFDADSLRMIEYRVEKPVVIRIATRNAISAVAAALAAESNGSADAGPEALGDANEGDLERLRDFAQQAPIVRLVSRIAQMAADEKATDIHIEPFEHEVRIRIRVDGMLSVAETVPASYLPGVSTRLKILANLDISERRLPQDGRIRIAVRGQEIDMRISVIPAIHGETIVMRLLDRSSVALDLKGLGFDAPTRASLERIARLPNGIILITGPTGSGKTTTLYALMTILNDPSVKIFTVEDPVEYQLTGITQLQVNNATGMTFARALRSVLRQDPDIILIGEIRDKETAEIAMQAALTGHLVLSTLHTNSAVGAITRLRDMGMEDYLIGATVKGIVGQRLLRKLCRCAKEQQTSSCDDCGGSGFKGRTVTHEIIGMSDDAARLISSRSSEDAIFDHLRGEGMKTMEEHARELVDQGATTYAEVARAIRLGAQDAP